MKVLVALFLALSALVADAASKYVREAAAGAGTGADWTDAYTALPATLTRGDTYYIADGAYAAYTFDDAISGTTLITIKKATVTSRQRRSSSIIGVAAVFSSPANLRNGVISISTPLFSFTPTTTCSMARAEAERPPRATDFTS